MEGESKAIEDAVNAALDKAAKTDGPWKQEPVNWGDLSGYVSRYGGYLITIEEASPSCPELHQFVRDELIDAGFDPDEFSIVTEW